MAIFIEGREVAEVIMAQEAPQRKAKTAGFPDECWNLARVCMELRSK